jgi:hypothetical protein
MATTTNYGWDTPDDTDLVKDGAAAIRTLGSSVDTTTKALNPSTTLGDLEYRSATANTNTRLGIGSTGNVLTVDGGVPTWAAPASGAKTYALLNAGGTALTGATTITVSSIGGKNDYLFYIAGASSVNVSTFTLRFNSDSGGNYQYISNITNAGGPSMTIGQDTAGTSLELGDSAPGASVGINCYLEMRAGDSTTIKPFNFNSIRTNGGEIRYWNGYYKGTSAISSVSIISSSGNFDAGTIFVYGA